MKAKEVGGGRGRREQISKIDKDFDLKANRLLRILFYKDRDKMSWQLNVSIK